MSSSTVNDFKKVEGLFNTFQQQVQSQDIDEARKTLQEMRAIHGKDMYIKFGKMKNAPTGTDNLYIDISNDTSVIYSIHGLIRKADMILAGKSNSYAGTISIGSLLSPSRSTDSDIIKSPAFGTASTEKSDKSTYSLNSDVGTETAKLHSEEYKKQTGGSPPLGYYNPPSSCSYEISKPCVVTYWSSTCGHCKQFMYGNQNNPSPWSIMVQDASQRYPGYQFMDVQTDSSELDPVEKQILRSLLGQTGVSGVPSIAFYLNDNSYSYDGPRRGNEFMQFLSRFN